MKRPGKAGLLILLAFAIVFAVEFHTVLTMVGVEVAASVYYPVITLLIATAFAALYLFTEGNGKKPVTA